MAVIFVCGWECRDVGASSSPNPDEKHWDTATASAPTISTSTVRSGTAALRCNASAAAVRLGKTISASTLAGRVYFRLATLPASGTPFIVRVGNVNGNGGLQLASNGDVTLIFGTGAASTALATVTTGVWYRFDFLADTTTGTASIKGTIDGGTERTATGTQSAVANTELGCGWGASTTADIFYDDLVLGDATADYPFGPGTVERMKPTRDGTHSFTAADFGYNTAGGDVATSATDVNTYVDDDALTSTADLIRQKVVRTAGYVEVGFGSAPFTYVAQAVNVISSWHAAGTGADTMGMKLNDNGTLKNVTNEAGDGLTDVSNTTVMLLEKVLTVAPSTSAAWTATRLGAVLVRAGYSGDVNAIPYWDGVMLEVAYKTPIVVTPDVLALTLTTYAPAIGQGVVPPLVALTLATFAPTVSTTAGTTATPGLATLTLTTFAPTVVLPQTFTPGLVALTTTTFAPVVALTVTPPLVALTLATFAPTLALVVTAPLTPLSLTTFAPSVTASDNKTVVPGVVALSTSLLAASTIVGTVVTPPLVALSLATFAPSVTASDNKVATPDLVALAATTFAPTAALSDNKVATPDLVALSLATFAPSVTATAHQTVTPDAVALTLTAFAPSVTATAHQTVVPSLAALSLTTFAPTAATGGNQTVTPSLATLALATFAPAVAVSDNRVAVPDTVALTLATFAPAITQGLRVTPPTTALSLATFVPTVVLPKTVTPPLAALSLATFAPRLGAGVIAAQATLSLATFAPTVSLSDNQVAVPTPAGLVVVTFAPGVELGGSPVATPQTGTLALVGYVPHITYEPTGGLIYRTPVLAPGGATGQGPGSGGTVGVTARLGGTVSRNGTIGGGIEVE